MKYPSRQEFKSYFSRMPRWVILLILVLLAAAGLASAATIHVPGDYATIAEALANQVPHPNAVRQVLERRRELRMVTAAGIPVIQWRGPGSLDQVIRDIARRTTGPRLVRR